jgi:hypothetical protein
VVREYDSVVLVEEEVLFGNTGMIDIDNVVFTI